MWILAIAGYTIWVVYELMPLYKQKYWRDLWFNIMLGVLSLSIALLLCFDVKIPSPEKPVREFMTSLFRK